MNKLVLIAGGSTLVYAGLALMMCVLPGIELSNVPAGPGVQPLTALESDRELAEEVLARGPARAPSA